MLIKLLCQWYFVNQVQIKLLTASFQFLVFITMSETKKRKQFSIQEKTDILAQVDANEETHHVTAARL